MNTEKKPENPPAFPMSASFDTLEGRGRNYTHACQEGMTLRDYFAAKAMQGLLANGFWALIEHEKAAKRPGDYSIDNSLSERAYEIADAMLRARDQQ